MALAAATAPVAVTADVGGSSPTGLRPERPAADAGMCGDPSWTWTAEECEYSASKGDGGGDVYGGRRRKYVPPPRPCLTEASFPWCDTGKTPRERAKLLVGLLNWTELAAQTSCDIFGGVPAVERLRVNAYNFIRENNHGLLWNEICPVPTVFPQVISMGASFNETLWRAVGEASAVETRWNYEVGKQNSLFTQVNFNIFLDPRWGRGQEVPGEDPHLNSEYARAWVAGVQAPKGPGGAPLAGASCKHFAAYSLEGAGGWPDPAPDSNRHNFDAKVPAQDLADTHLPMFRACAEEGAVGMMTSYNAINGVPSAANGKLTNGVARDAWGFDGAVVTDCGAVEDLWRRHRYAANATEAAWAALRGGTNIECGSTIRNNAQPEMEPLLRQAVENNFAVRFRLGEFDPAPASSAAGAPPPYDAAAHARLAHEAAVQGAVLLKNIGGALPLSPSARLAIAGPLKTATWEALGNYAPVHDLEDWSNSPNVVSPLQGLQRCAALREPLAVVDGGPYVCSSTDQAVPGFRSKQEAPDADVVVLVVGLYPQDPEVGDVDIRPQVSGKCQGGCLETEGCDRPDLRLPPGQRQLIRRAVGWGRPVVLVVIAGGALDLSEYEEEDAVKAILWAGYPGQATGTAIARMLLGFDSPSGRLTQTFYRSAYLDAISITDMGLRPRPGGYPGRTHRFVDPKWVLYPFGHGLSYHPWRYEWSGSGKAEAGKDGFASCTVRIRASSGDAPGAPAAADASASVLLFLRPPPGAPTGAPVRQLAKFVRVHGNSSEATLGFGARDFELADAMGVSALRPGSWAVEVGEPVVLQGRISVTDAGCEASLDYSRIALPTRLAPEAGSSSSLTTPLIVVLAFVLPLLLAAGVSSVRRRPLFVSSYIIRRKSAIVKLDRDAAARLADGLGGIVL